MADDLLDVLVRFVRKAIGGVHVGELCRRRRAVVVGAARLCDAVGADQVAERVARAARELAQMATTDQHAGDVRGSLGQVGRCAVVGVGRRRDLALAGLHQQPGELEPAPQARAVGVRPGAEPVRYRSPAPRQVTDHPVCVGEHCVRMRERGRRPRGRGQARGCRRVPGSIPAGPARCAAPSRRPRRRLAQHRAAAGSGAHRASTAAASGAQPWRRPLTRRASVRSPSV